MASWAQDYFCGPDWKAPKQQKLTTLQWAELRERMLTHASCVSCGLPHRLTLHHIVGKDRHGDDHELNLIPLCMGPGSPDCHGRFERHAQDWRRVAASIRSFIYGDEGRLTYVLGMLGQDLLDRTYPAIVEACNGRTERGFNNWGGCDLPAGHPGEHAVIGDECFQRERKEASDFAPYFQNPEPQ